VRKSDLGKKKDLTIKENLALKPSFFVHHPVF
jgi:hypothetical protein